MLLISGSLVPRFLVSQPWVPGLEGGEKSEFWQKLCVNCGEGPQSPGACQDSARSGTRIPVESKRLYASRRPCPAEGGFFSPETRLPLWAGWKFPHS